LTKEFVFHLHRFNFAGGARAKSADAAQQNGARKESNSRPPRAILNLNKADIFGAKTI
jgi:hypothetical protein